MPETHRTTGVLLMIVAMLSLPSVDGIAKYLSADYSPLFISWARYVVACCVVLPVAAIRHGSAVFPAERRWSHVSRTALLVTSMTLYFLAIAQTELATAASAFMVGPLIAVGLSIVVLKERMTIIKGLSLALGFVGSIVILRPGATLDWGTLFALGSGLTFGIYLVVTRQASQTSDPIKTLALQCALGALLLTPQAIVTWAVPAWNDLVFFLGLGIISAASHLMSIAAFRLADASTLSPLVYLELVGAALIGYFAFHEVPDLPTIIGAGFICAAGFILVHRRAMRS